MPLSRAASGVSASPSDDDDGGPRCRLCWATAATDETGPMLAPCQCRGTMAHIHLACLRRWLEVQRHEQGRSRARAARCEVCKARYRGADGQPLGAADGGGGVGGLLLPPHWWNDPWAVAAVLHGAWRAYVAVTGITRAFAIYRRIHHQAAAAGGPALAAKARQARQGGGGGVAGAGHLPSGAAAAAAAAASGGSGAAAAPAAAGGGRAGGREARTAAAAGEAAARAAGAASGGGAGGLPALSSSGRVVLWRSGGGAGAGGGGDAGAAVGAAALRPHVSLSLSLPFGPAAAAARQAAAGSAAGAGPAPQEVLDAMRERFVSATMVQVNWYTGILALTPTPPNADAFAGMALGAAIGGVVAQMVFLPMLGSGKLAALRSSCGLLVRCLLRLLAAEASSQRGYHALARLCAAVMAPPPPPHHDHHLGGGQGQGRGWRLRAFALALLRGGRGGGRGGRRAAAAAAAAQQMVPLALVAPAAPDDEEDGGVLLAQ